MSTTELAVAEGRPHPGFGHRLWRIWSVIWKIGAGIILCSTPLTAVLVLGWMTRLMRRETVRYWYARSAASRQTPFSHAAREDPDLRPFANLPNWVLGKPAPNADGGYGVGLNRALGGLWSNLREGITSLINIWVLTLPFSVLWLLSWWGGWQNSFTKGYEQSWVGPSLALVAILIFIVVMMHLHLAMARQAAGGEARRFYDLGRVRLLFRHAPISLLTMAVLFNILAFPLFLARSLPAFIEGIHPEFLTYSEVQIAAFIRGYFFWTTVYLFAALYILRRSAGRFYGRAVLAILRRRGADAAGLSTQETRILKKIGLLTDTAASPSHSLAVALDETGGRVLRFALYAATGLAWFGVVAQLYVGQFFNHAWWLWVNHPLIQLPFLVRP